MVMGKARSELKFAVGMLEDLLTLQQGEVLSLC